MSDEIMERFKSVMIRDWHFQDAIVVPEASLQNDLGIDSLQMVEVLVALEKEFDISISDGDAANLDVVSAMVDYIREKV